MSTALVVFIASFLVLLWSSKLLSQSISGIARVLRLSEFITAFFLVALATSVPELFVGISSAIQDIPGVSLGNTLGANLINLTWVIGLAALVSGAVKGDGKISSQNFWLIFLIAVLPMLLAIDDVISRVDGIILLLVFGLYVVKLFHDQQYFHKEMEGEPGLQPISSAVRHFGEFLLGIVLLLGSSFALIWSSKLMVAEYFGENLVLFGALFIALGTTLPELAFGIRSAMGGRGHLMLGNSVGTIAFNAAGVIGIVALINPIELDFNHSLLLISLFLFLAFALFHIFVYTRNQISRKEGIILIIVYVAFFVATFSGSCFECFIE